MGLIVGARAETKELTRRKKQHLLVREPFQGRP